MPREISVNREKGYVFVRTYGSVSQSRGDDVFERVERYCDKHDLNHVLVDHSEVEHLPDMLVLFDLGKQFAASIGRRFHVAAVQGSGKIRKDQRFFETVTLNRGAKFRLFATREEAEEWLLRKPLPPPNQSVETDKT